MLPALVCNAAVANAMEKWKRIIADTHTTIRNRLQRIWFPYLETMRQNDAHHRVDSLTAKYHKTPPLFKLLQTHRTERGCDSDTMTWLRMLINTMYGALIGL